MKQRCESEQFIVSNDNLEMLARFFKYQTEVEGKRARQRRDRESVCVRGRALRREKDSVSHKIDH